MAAGYNALATADEINRQAGRLVVQLRDLFADVRKFQAWLTATDLQAAPFSFSASDEAQVKSSFSNIIRLADTYIGNDVISPAEDMEVFARGLYGPKV